MPSSAAARQNMVLGQLYTNDIVDTRILEAMATIAREPFLPGNLRGVAYVDEDLEVANGRYLMAPLTFARLLDLAGITPHCRVLNIGCGNGYSAAIIGKLGAHVVAVDSDANAVAQAHDHMRRLGISTVSLQLVRNMADGYTPSAPYNVIVIQGAIECISETLGAQLAVGGRLVAVRNIARRPDIKGGLGKGLLVTKLDHTLQYREHFDASCPVLPGFEQDAAFIF